MSKASNLTTDVAASQDCSILAPEFTIEVN